MSRNVMFSSRLWALSLSSFLLLSACGVPVEPSAPPASPGAIAESDQPAPSTEGLLEAYQMGGRATVRDAGKEAFSHRIPNPDLNHRTQFFTGESLFDQNWVAAPASTVARDGLGPLFNARSCAACHGKDGRTDPFLSTVGNESIPSEALLVRLSALTDNPQQDQRPHAVLGGQLQPFALPRLQGEGQLQVSWLPQEGHYADGETYTLMKPQFVVQTESGNPADFLFSARQSPQLVGLGLLEQISDQDILAHQDPEDTNQDGISGRANQVFDVVQQKQVLGRFGWKANQPNIRQQVAAAFNGDIGITTSLFPTEELSPSQIRDQEDLWGAPVPSGAKAGEVELPDRLLDRVTFYIQNLAVPARRDPGNVVVKQGEQVFNALNCQKCHVPRFEIQTPQGPDTITPYTDLLLHDMGPELSDQRPDFEATGQEWRTPPLWGIGLIQTVNGHHRFLHDGRARNLTEAVLWHGGEAKASQTAFKALSSEDRQALIAFLESL